MALFEFELFPIEDFEPFSHEGEKRLSWYTLTPGFYHLNVKGKKLFQYSDEIMRYWKDGTGDNFKIQFVD